MQPTPRAVLLFALTVALAVPWTLLAGDWWQLGVALPLTALLALGIDAALAPRRARLSVETKVPEMLAIGRPARLTVSVRTGRNIGGGRCAVLPEVSGPLQSPVVTEIDWTASGTAVAEWLLQARRRGIGRLERIWLRWTGPLGLMAVHGRFEIGRAVAATPDIAAVRAVALRFAQNDALFGQKTMHQHGEGSEFRALREYAPGLDPRSIDWKQSAKHRALMCKEYFTERNQQVVFAFDCGHLMSEPLEGVPRLDHAINAALQMSWVSLDHGDRVGVFGFDARVRRYARPVGGAANFALIQRQMAELEYRPEESNYTLGLMDLMGRLDRRSLIVVMTDFVDTVTAELMLDNLQRLSVRHLVLFVALRDRALDTVATAKPRDLRGLARSVLANDFVAEREVVLQRLQRLGVLCIDTEPGRLGTEMVNRYLDIKRREML
ncbi:MAG TPA: DUF58 domain-containing protein [Reyranella sp.]|nr:DUF58 domain-containing protein [Reyranella sp.]